MRRLKDHRARFDEKCEFSPGWGIIQVFMKGSRCDETYLGLVLGKELDAVGLWLRVTLGRESAPDDLILVVERSNLGGLGGG